MKRKFSVIILSVVLTIGMLLPLTAMADGAPYALREGPSNLTAELKEDIDGIPYFELKWDMPPGAVELAEEISAVNGFDDNPLFPGYNTDYIVIQFDFKYGKYDWNEGPTAHAYTDLYADSFVDGNYVFEYRPYDSSNNPGEVVIKSETYQFRARLESKWAYKGDSMDKYIYSPYSNTVTIGNPTYWSNVSTWATPELQKAADAGLIPGILKGADMTKPITREEFAEVALLMYQKASSKTDTEPTAPNPFTDTQNQQILKAYKLGIIKGMSDTTFAPQTLINREQVAAMLTRTIKLVAPNADYSTSGAPSFADQSDISGWALNDCLYIAKLGIIKGSDGKFMPRAVTQAQIAAGYANTSREQALAMSVRTVDKII